MFSEGNSEHTLTLSGHKAPRPSTLGFSTTLLPPLPVEFEGRKDFPHQGRSLGATSPGEAEVVLLLALPRTKARLAAVLLKRDI